MTLENGFKKYFTDFARPEKAAQLTVDSIPTGQGIDVQQAAQLLENMGKKSSYANTKALNVLGTFAAPRKAGDKPSAPTATPKKP